MNKELDFSIITPSYNYSQYIREMLDSVRDQEGVTFEHLIYDAVSTDGTIDIIREYDHVSLVVEKDKGMSDAINKGFKKAKGKWVMWLNADDRLELGALAEVKKFADSHFEADVIYGEWNFMDGGGNYQRTMRVFPFRRLMLIHHSCYIASTATFFRRSTILDHGHYLNIKFKCLMDGEYYSRLASEGKLFISFPKELASFRLHGDNISQRVLAPQNMDEMLDRQQQFAESRAIKRIYGVTLFESDHMNSVVDCCLFYYFKVMKLFVRVIYSVKRK